MSQKPGSIGWVDLTVPDAENARDFYEAVVGFSSEPVDMGGYDDFNMIPPASKDAACGVCHARGVNADVPPVWMVYFIVEDIERSVEATRQRGGTVILGPKSMGDAHYCIIKDPSGAACALYQPA